MIGIVGEKGVMMRRKERVVVMGFEFGVWGVVVREGVVVCRGCIEIKKIRIGMIVIGMIVVEIVSVGRGVVCGVVKMVEIGELECVGCVSWISV